VNSRVKARCGVAGVPRRRPTAKAAPPPRAVIVHSLDHARLALAAARAAQVPIILRSAPGAASYAGAGWFAAMTARAAREFPGVAFTAALDCGSDPGHAMAALREGVRLVRLSGPARVRAKIASMAKKSGAALDEDDAAALDLLTTANPAVALRDWLASA
jgi:hypothetical protein